MIQRIKDFFKRKKELSPDIVQQYYEQWTDNYIQNFGDIFQSYATTDPAALIHYMAQSAGIQDGYKVLDAGCGIAGPAILLAEKFPAVQISGITISPTQTVLAQQKIAAKNLASQINIRTADFHQLETLFPANHFDTILFLESLVHSHQPEQVIKSCHRVIKTGGTIYIKDLFRHYDATIQRDIDFAVNKVEELIKLKVQDVTVIEKILREHNFEIDFVRPLNVTPDFTKGNQFMANNHFRIFKNRNEDYTGTEFQYLMYYEVKATKK